MNGEIAAAKPRLAPPASRNNSALQGATIAFSNSKASSNVASPPSAAARAAVASTLNRHADRCLEMESENAPVVGSVRDKIGLFAANNTLPPPRAVSRGRTPPPSVGQIAARLAIERSPSRVQQATAAVAAAKISAARSASRMQSQAPEERRELRSPTPIRPRDTAKENPVNAMLRDGLALSEPESEPELYKKPPSLPPRAASVRVPATSPHPSVSSRMTTVSLDDTKPNLPPRTAPSRASTRNPVFTGTPLLRPSTPSMASVSGLSYHSSSSANEPGMDEEALSNAIVASSLASARASPATKLAPPPPPSRRRARSRSILQFAHSPKSDLSRTPSPPKGMPMTLRGMPKAEEADARRRHKMNLLHKHPHKHHEGDRKRWRREVTEKERKRYEGVWASNKGLLIPPDRRKTGGGPNGAEKGPPASEMVLNLVAREIWSRSRLPPAVLAQVWDLVDSQQIGLLTKEEFVVGMWLIDQQLKGHKLPVKVPETVWDSVRYVTGIKLSSVGPKG
ncbi:Increased rDNA silencing protein 4 [Penicillium subrubescens]|uniref:Increased rDNA silencing protein 4 n=1 Tax=Penicillium subrubescens TaxID=1316194 RepID=A0A1Q5UDS6_9EURO|nr:Increased rDNA silencing protein 4 [Penicillium subrubescens]KAJ5881263.1 Increased rDNA silencing protein 4 [Penicillium subrubescens]OKP10613.1 Increased rDNA silencing protein 4 [Penicillium subrubescens]